METIALITSVKERNCLVESKVALSQELPSREILEVTRHTASLVDTENSLEELLDNLDTKRTLVKEAINLLEQMSVDGRLTFQSHLWNLNLPGRISETKEVLKEYLGKVSKEGLIALRLAKRSIKHANKSGKSPQKYLEFALSSYEDQASNISRQLKEKKEDAFDAFSSLVEQDNQLLQIFADTKINSLEKLSDLLSNRRHVPKFGRSPVLFLAAGVLYGGIATAWIYTGYYLLGSFFILPTCSSLIYARILRDKNKSSKLFTKIKKKLAHILLSEDCSEDDSLSLATEFLKSTIEAVKIGKFSIQRENNLNPKDLSVVYN